MDFRRAKVILIAAFALLDAFLFWRVAAGAQLAAPGAGGSRPTVSMATLRHEGIELDLAGHGVLPARSASVPLLSVRLETPDGRSLVGTLFGGRQVKTSRFPATGQVQAEIYRTAAEELAVLRFGVVSYRRLAPPVAAGKVDPQRAMSEAVAFLKRLGGLPPGGRFDYAGPVPGSALYQVRYVEYHQGLPLFPGYLAVTVDAHGVYDARRYWLKVVPAARAAPSRPTIGAAQALLQLAAGEHASAQHPLRIVGLRLGYYSLGNAAARQWQVVPAWRIRLAGGGVYYINAYTGALEE